jgi:hypothetical protein
MAKWKPVDKNCEDCGELMVQVAPQKRFCPECARKRNKKSIEESHAKDVVAQMFVNPHAKYCFGCVYWRSEYGSKYCNYIFDEGHRRPCMPGKDCTEKKTKW